uniref:VPS9 domain-containing protein n=1 Tax=Nothobranchius furzeri TaxID=105023 RepID=A0A8C6LI81_NOTFU
MHEAYSPNKKILILLKVCKSIYHSMSANGRSGTVFGADDFLPCLTWVLLRSDLATLQVDTDYMMELLDPTQLQGEGGYYLTTLYAALFYISSFRPRLAARQLSVEAQNSINQWHRRRTLHCHQSRRSNPDMDVGLWLKRMDQQIRALSSVKKGCTLLLCLHSSHLLWSLDRKNKMR